jgi:hypothetical protein
VLILTATPPLGALSAKAILLKPVDPKKLFKMIKRFLAAKN